MIYPNLLGNVGNCEVDSNSDGLADGLSSSNGIAGTFSLNTSDYKYGKVSQQITHNANYARCSWRYDVTKDGFYYFSFWVKCLNVNNIYYAFQKNSDIDSCNGAATSVNTLRMNTINNGNCADWTLFSVTAFLKAGDYVRFGLYYATASGAVALMDGGMVLNLTDLFGGDNVPSISVIDTMITSAVASNGYTLLTPSLINMLASYGNFSVDSNSDGLADGWSKVLSGTLSLAANIQNFTSAGQNGGFDLTTGVPCAVGDKLYACAYVYPLSNLSGFYMMIATPGNIGSSNITGGALGKINFTSVLATSNGTSAKQCFRDSRSSGWTGFQVRQAHMLNLTAIFGAGKEPTQAQMDNIMQALLMTPLYNNLIGDAAGYFTTDSNLDGLADGWTGTNITNKSVSNNIQIFTPTAPNGNISRGSFSANLNDILYVSCYVSTLDNQARPVIFLGGSSYLVQTSHSGSGNFEFLSARGTAAATGGQYTYLESARASGWTAIQVKQYFILNLTQIFGAGSEPTKAVMDSIMKKYTSPPQYFSTYNPSIATAMTAWNRINEVGAVGNFSLDTNGDGLADGWSQANMTSLSVDGNVQCMTPTAQYAWICAALERFTPAERDKIYVRAEVKSSRNDTRLILTNDSNAYVTVLHSGSGNFEVLSLIGVQNRNVQSMYPAIQTAAASGWTQIQVKNVEVWNLTAIFGSGNEPSLAWCDANISFIQFKTDFSANDYYNYPDLNRVENDIYEVACLLGRYSNFPSLQALITNRTNFSIDYYDSLNRIESNILALKNAATAQPDGWIPPKTNWLPVELNNFSYIDANRLETDLSLLYNMIQNIRAYLQYSGTFYCGQDNTIL